MYLIFLIILVSIITIFKFIETTKVINLQKQFVIISVVLCSLLMGLRGATVGTDTMNYRFHFDVCSKYNVDEILSSFYFYNQESLYGALMKLSYLICEEYVFFQIWVSVMMVSITVFFLYKNSNDVYYSVILYLGVGLYILGFNVTRQMLSVSVCLLSFYMITKRKNVLALITFVTALCIHSSSIVFIIALVLMKFKINSIIIKLFPIFLLATSLFASVVFNEYIAFIPRYSMYSANNSVTQSANLVQLVWVIIVLMALYMIYFVRDYNLKIYAFLSLVYVLFNIIGLKINFIERLGLYFLPFIILVFDNMAKLISNYKIKLSYYLISASCFICFFLRVVLSHPYYKDYCMISM